MFSKALLISSLISVTFATVFVTNPVASTTLTGGQPATITWEDDGNPPTLAEFGSSMISIYSGNAQQQTSLKLLNNSLDVSSTSSLTFTVDPTIGPNSGHYFIRFQSNNGKNGSNPDLAFSAQFTLTNMTGTFSPLVQSEIDGLSTAPLATAMPTASGGLTSTPSLTTSLTSTKGSSTASATSTSKASSGAISIKAGWVGLVFGAIVGATMF
jgi:uncharacterized transporter YbjL